MKITNAIKKLEKSGFTVTQNGQLYTGRKAGINKVVEFSRNGRSEDATCIGFRHVDDHNDSMTDYCATLFCNSLTQAIKCAQS